MKVHREGTGLLLTLFTLLFVVDLLIYYTIDKGFFFYLFTASSVVFFALVLNFFRSPHRRFPYDSEGLVIAPADGTVVAIEEVAENEYFHDRRLQVSIFMSVFNVHANWYPVNGVVKHVSHQKGRFQAAYLPKSSTDNERSTIVITTSYGVEVLTRQVAGALARRIVTYASEGRNVTGGQELGFIKFGSRVDVYLPLDADVLVNVGDRVRGVETALARLR